MRQYPRSHRSRSWLGQALAILCVVSVVASVSIPTGPGPADGPHRPRGKPPVGKESVAGRTHREFG